VFVVFVIMYTAGIGQWTCSASVCKCECLSTSTR
jgi:hypothetical protein